MRTDLSLARATRVVAPIHAGIEEWLPRDPRSIGLGCGFAGLAALGLVGVLDGDSLGYAYLSCAAVGLFFVQTRGLPAFIWLLVSGGGVWAVTSGSTPGWVEFGLGTALAIVSLLPPRVQETQNHPGPQANLKPTSSFPEVSRPASNNVTSIETFGRLKILAADEDLAPNLLDKRVLGYIWCSLLVAALRSPNGGHQRGELASELSPGPNRRSQVERLRRQLWDLQHDLPEPLSAIVRVDRTLIRLDLEGIACDLLELRRLADRVRAAHSGPAADLLAEIRSCLELSSGRFLAEFDDLARAAHQSRSSAMQTVGELRTWVLETRISLGQYLARHSTSTTPKE